MKVSFTLELHQLMDEMGMAGIRLSDLGAAEGAAGNISVCIREQINITANFQQVEMIELPHPVPELAGATLIVSGSGCRLREIADAPMANLACVLVEQGGRTGKMFTSPNRLFGQITSEFNSHLAVHCDQMRTSEMDFHTVLHGQPIYLTFLSHVPEYQDEKFLNRQLLRWQPETILNLPEGIGILPFLPPGSSHLVTETRLSLRTHRIVVWSRHGVMARSDNSISHAADLIEYAETAAHYEFLNLATDEMSDGLSPDQIREICKSWNVQQDIF